MYWSHWIIVAIVAPLLGGALTPAVSAGRRWLAPWWALGVATLTSAATGLLIYRVATRGPFSYLLGGWPRPFGIEMRFDEFSAFAGVVCLILWLAVVYSFRYVERMEGLAEERVPYYYALLLLNAGGMIGISSTGDLFNFFVFLEILSLSGYALVAISGELLASMAAFKYLVMGAISSLLALFAIGLIYALTGSLNMADIGVRLALVTAREPLVLALGLFVVGMLVKAAVFPLHIWLPDAHAIAPSPVSAILSALVVNIGVLGLIRITQMFNVARVLDLGVLNQVLVWLGAISILMGAFFAIFQDDIKMMLAYSTISNIGYIIMGIGLASPLSVMGAAVHVFNHAIIKSALFLGAGALIYMTGFRSLRDLRGVGHSMPLTCGALTVAAVSIVGIPPTAGFLCKWYIALGAIEAGQPAFGFVLIFGALFIFVYFIRMINALYFKDPIHREVAEATDPPMLMLAPLLFLALLCLVMGIFGGVPLHFIQPGVTRLLAGLGG